MANLASNLLDYADVLVWVVALALYLADLSKLLFVNEVLLTGGIGARTEMRLPSSGIELGQRYAVFSQALTPGVVMARGLWPQTSQATATNEVLEQLASCARALRVPRIACTLLLPQLLFGIPLMYYASGTIAAVTLLIAIYLQVVIVLIWACMQRAALGLTWMDLLSVAFDSLICIPYAINLHRKLAQRMLARLPRFDAEAMAALVLEPTAHEHFQEQLAKSSAQRLHYETEGTELHAALQRLAESRQA